MTVAALICLKGFAASLRCGNNHAEKSPKDPERTPRGFHRVCRPQSGRQRRSNRLFLGDDLHRHIGGDVRHQTNGDDVFAGRLDGAERRANLRLLDLEAELVHRFSDVGVGDGAEQTAVDAALAGDRNFSAVELAGEFFGGSDASSLSLFEFSAASFEFGDSLLRGALGVTLGDALYSGSSI